MELIYLISKTSNKEIFSLWNVLQRCCVTWLNETAFLEITRSNDVVRGLGYTRSFFLK